MTWTQAANVIVIVQIVTFVALAPILTHIGSWRLGAAQGLLAIITWLVYWA